MLVDWKDFSLEKKTIGSAKGGKVLTFVKPWLKIYLTLDEFLTFDMRGAGAEWDDVCPY